MQTINATKVMTMVKKGCKLYLGRSSNGDPKVKVARGPFGIFVWRYAIDEEQFQILKTSLDQVRH
ncbi:MAG: hypothetical protein KGO94_09725 [Alphaproteobacteria bacterium]|nr:hypothetical protein [Alphaproteobacteria bacterium]